jgi:hypothetical protein
MSELESQPRVQFKYDLDNEDTFKACWQRLQAGRTRNFLVDFEGSRATCSVDLDVLEVSDIIQPVGDRTTTRWINFWGGNAQKDAIKAVANTYGVSPRLMNLLCPEKPHDAGDSPVNIEVLKHSSNEADTDRKYFCRSAASKVGDAEKALYSSEQSLSPEQSEFSGQDTRKAFGNIVEDIWHFCSVDWGQRYIYVGYNSLFSIPEIKIEAGPNKPAGLRVWTSLVLCDDGTVISVIEDRNIDNRLTPETVRAVRRNALNVFRHLSKFHIGDTCEESMMTVNIRNADISQKPSTKTASEGASLLLYYLFDDWVTTYGLVTQRQHPYRKELERLRRQMFERPGVDLIDSLHSTGRQLTVLKLMYQSYELIGTRLLQRDRTKRDHTCLQQQHLPFGHSQNNSLSEDLMNQNTSDVLSIEFSSSRVRLSPSAAVRFQRLVDRVRLYALNDIEECLNEKESLVFMVCTALDVSSRVY